MIHAHFTYFDMTVLGVMGLSCLFAFFRGFVKEVLSLGAWIGAGLVTIYFFPDVARIIEPHVKKNPIVAAGFASLGLYVVSLLGFSFINMLILRLFKDSKDVGMTDNLLGLVFGAVRGAFLLSLAYLAMTIVLGEENHPDWLKEAHTKPYVEQGALLLARAAPGYLQELTSLKKNLDDTPKHKAYEATSEDEESMQKLMQRLEQPSDSEHKPAHVVTPTNAN